MDLSFNRKTALVTGANGYIGNAVCRVFVRAGWTVYGLARKQEALQALAAEEIIPVHGALGDNSFLTSLFARQKTFDVIVSTTEHLPDFGSHFNNIMSMILEVAKSSSSLGVRQLLLFSSGCKDYGMTVGQMRLTLRLTR
jgi:NAD(P)-dependent dehydrogenase (short-subunit alcohol dehydrogenase family)